MNNEIMEATIVALRAGKATPTQFQALELFITQSLTLTVRAKKAVLWFLRQSNFLQREMAMTVFSDKLEGDEYEFGKEIAYGVHNMSNTLYNTFCLMGMQKCISSGQDYFEDVGKPHGYTIWLSYRPFSMEVGLVKFDLEEVMKTKLRRNYSESPTSDISDYYEDSKIPKQYLEVTCPNN